ncbi:ABC transporter permease [Streptomyces daliensis]|uniref:ABC transporter permease n=1 Tax=Streptomyces daliensis TaxID=299421 RepID=A0A8T4ISS7_9ACTN|nr:ABC transporter permease [Streptomyces daliensis]
MWARDLFLGARFAVGGGRQGWTRTLLTAVGVGLGVALLLLATSVPEIIDNRSAREEARSAGTQYTETEPPRTERTMLTSDANTRFHGEQLYGRQLRAEGSDPILPPGVEKLPGPGEMIVSPALKEYLATDEGKVLAGRLDARVVGGIGDEGLLGPGELAFYKGSSDISLKSGAHRVEGFAQTEQQGEQPMDPTILLLVVVACAVLVMPIAAFVATAVRFGGERRDARLAALRLVGTDARMTRRIAAGESLVGALLGLVAGAWFFLLGRTSIAAMEISGISVFPSDVLPAPALVALIVLAVPVAAVLVTLFAMRGIAVEPLGVVRQSARRSRRLWWRLLPTAAGVLLLVPLAGSLTGDEADVDTKKIVAAVVLLLSGAVLLLPWAVERVVRKLSGGPLSWQLATRRLQLSSGVATRAVSGITIAVAGAIALQMVFTAVEAKATQDTGQDPALAQAQIYGQYTTVEQAAKLNKALKGTDGVKEAQGSLQAYVGLTGTTADGVSVTVGDCATLRELARIGDCREGQTFLARSSESDEPDEPQPERGDRLALDEIEGGGSKAAKDPRDRWTVPGSAKEVTSRKTADGQYTSGVMVTPSAMPVERLKEASYRAAVRTDLSDPEAMENVRTTVFQADPAYNIFEMKTRTTSGEFLGIQRGLTAASAAVLLLIGFSMIITTLEQLRERKRQLSVLVAFGTRRSTLGASVLWQTAVPVVLGLALATVFGLGLGWGLLRTMGQAKVDWLAFLPAVGVGFGVIAMVTLVSLPPLWRMMRPDGLRTE